MNERMPLIMSRTSSAVRTKLVAELGETLVAYL
jgi:hypothetical protein